MSSPKINQPKILLYDLEVSRMIVEGYGNRYEFKLVQVVRHQSLMSYAYKWLGDTRIHFRHLHGYPNYQAFVESLRDLQDEANIAIAHNSKFDDKMSNRFFIEQGIDPPSPYKTIDTLQVARSNFKFPGNSLKELSEFLNLGTKEKITYADVESDFLNNPTRKIIKQLETYNKKDIELLEGIYLKMRPFMKTHPNVSVITENIDGCPKCGSHNRQYRGFNYTNTTVYRRIRCNDCGGWYRERTQDKDLNHSKPEFVV